MSASQAQQSVLPHGWRINDDGTVSEELQGRTWMRVPYGMTWGAGGPTGQPTQLSWFEATKRFGEGVLAYRERTQSSYRAPDWEDTDVVNGFKRGASSTSFEFAGMTGWRLPTAKEWCSIQFDGDVSLSRLLFPADSGGAYWTASLKYRLNLLVVRDVIAWKGWFGRPTNDENAKHRLDILLVRASA